MSPENRLDTVEQAINLMLTELIPAIRLDAERTKELVQRADTRSAENSLRFDNLLAEARADREEWRKEFEEQKRINQALIDALSGMNARVTNLENTEYEH